MHASDAASCGRLRKLIGWTCLFALVALASEMVAQIGRAHV